MLNYAEQWAQQLLAIIIQGTLCSPFVTNNVKWLSAKTFHFTQMSTTGYKNHVRTGGWNRGVVAQADVPYTLYHDRDIEFMIDKADVDETNQTATIQNISQNFTDLNANPEIDAEFFGEVTRQAIDAGLFSETALTSYDTTNVYGRLKAMLLAGKLRIYKQRGCLIMYVNSTIMDLLERSKDFTRQIVMNTIADGGIGIQSRITDIDGVPLIEVIDDERFYSEFDFAPVDGGFLPAVGAQKLNVLIGCTETVKKVPKINSIYFFAPGTHTQGDGYLYQNRAYSGTFVFPNGKNNKVDSIFVDLDAVATGLTVTSVAGTASGDSLITVTEPALVAGNTFKYKSAAVVAIPAIGSKLGAGWATLVSGTDKTVTTGNKIVVVEIGVNGVVDRVSTAVTVVSKA